MADSPRRRRSPISIVFVIFVVAAMAVVMLVSRIRSFFRPNLVPIEQLKFPVLVIQPGGVPIFAEWDTIPLQKFEEKSNRTPVNGTVIIDSDFNQFTQENVDRKREGDIKWMTRHLFPGLMRVRYTFDLRRSKTVGVEAMRDLLRTAPPFSDDPKEDAAMRTAAIEQPTMAGVLDALKFFKPLPPPEPTVDANLSTTEPVAAEPTTQSDEKPPGDPI